MEIDDVLVKGLKQCAIII